MITFRTERAYAAVSKCLLTPLFFDNKLPSVVLGRVTDRLRRNRSGRVHLQCCFTTASQCRVETRPESRSSAWSPYQVIVPAPSPGPTPARRVTSKSANLLPQSCPGCGALTQESVTAAPGYYDRSRRAVNQYLRQQRRKANATTVGNTVVPKSVETPETEEEVAFVHQEEDGDQTDQPASKGQASQDLRMPLCDRCHDLIHNSRGQSIAHPSLENIADSIAESPFKRNHIYHVVDAADFPLSVVPGIFSKLALAKTRSQNRRSQHDFSSKPSISFIVTRSDLLGSTKEMVDRMMPHLQSVLRKALGRTGRDMRLGNVHLVSAKRGWWTKEIKEEIWQRGGGNWMVGKANVGKSNLFEVLFPKGSGERAPVYAELREKQHQHQHETSAVKKSEAVGDDLIFDENSLLPPAQPELPFPVFPVVSSLPGTTASPIRLPFGGHKGELIDLPGLDRGDLEKYVKPENRLDLVMTHRHNVEQHIIKPGQSLILGGGLIRITPKLDMSDPSTTMLAYPFVPLKAHVTSTEKAVLQQLQQRDSGIVSILSDDAGPAMASAGFIELSSDVTKSRSGHLIKNGFEMSALPFRIYATDVLVEGLGWIELVCQVRRWPGAGTSAKTKLSDQSDDTTSPDTVNQLAIPALEFAPFGLPIQNNNGSALPGVEVFSPNGKHISSRDSLQAWRRWTEGRPSKEGGKSYQKNRYLSRNR